MTYIKNWKDLKSALKNTFSELDSKFFESEEKDSEDLFKELQKTYKITKEDAQEKFKKFNDEFENNVKDIPGYVRKAGKAADNFSNAAADKVENLLDSCSQVGTATKAELEDGISYIVSYVQKHPIKALFMAISTGVLLSKVLIK